MFNITDADIRRGCNNNTTFEKGQRYYRERSVRNVRVEGSYAAAVVVGSEPYSVQIEFSHRGEIEDTECECAAYYSYPGYCKHIVALLYYLKDLDEKGIKAATKSLAVSKGSPAVREIINYFDSKFNIASKDFIDLEVTLEIIKSPISYSEIMPVISLRMGKEKLYVVKSIKKLVEAIERGWSIEFGKRFVFDLNSSRFKEEDLALIDFFREMYQIDNTIKRYSSYSYSNGSIFSGKHLYLTHISAIRFFKLMEGKAFKANVLGKEYDAVRIVKEDIPVEFLLKKQNDHLVLNVNISDEIIPITKDGCYIFLQGKVYHITETQRENLAPFYNAMETTKSKDIELSNQEAEAFASVVLPYLKKAGKLVIDHSIEDLFYQRPLEAKINLDKLGSKVVASFNFIYGDYMIDPFRHHEKSGENNIIIRDHESERRILDIVEKSGFKINKDEVYLEDDDLIYHFVNEGISKLQNYSEIYYSEAFKRIKIYDSTYYKGSIRLNEDSNLLNFEFSIEGVDRESLPEIFASLKEKKKYYRLPDGSFLPLDTEGLKNISSIVEYLDLKDRDLQEALINIPMFKAMYIDNKFRERNDIHIERNRAFKQLIESVKEPSDMEYEVPDSLKPIMRGYQVIGFKWLKTLSHYGFGGILADDMGLGKTLQTIAFLQSEKENNKQPSLVVCPTSLVYNWESEIQKFGSTLKVLVVTGSKDEREQLINNVQDVDVVITSYPLLRRDVEKYKELAFGYCILDEAQHIKNPGSVNAKSVKDIRAKGYFALTGTPIENNLTELWSIFDFIMPGYLLSNRRFVEKFERPIVSEQSKEALMELNKHTKPFILRRLKKDVLKELPPKIESTLVADLTEEQKKVYLAYLQQIKGQIEDGIKERGFEKSHIQILAGLTRLRQICCHPSLFVENYSGNSGKMDLLLELLQEAKEGGHRVLLFSQFTEALKLIKVELDKEDISYFYLDGSVKAEERRDMVAAFNKGHQDVFLISLKAGGTGLNLTGADTVIHFDPWWNPAVEEQATDRAYRIGQQNSVQVMKLIAKGTIEEKIIALQQRKRELIGSVLDNSESFITKMSEQDIKELFEIS